MPAPQTVIDLVHRFESQLASYKSGRYNETELRRDFLDPFFEALGWDVRNTSNAAEKYRDVIHESSVEIAGQAKSADYLFQIGGSPVFFVEAKKPSVNIESDPAPAFQLKSYAWSKKLPFSILTDFEQMSFYECLTKPAYDANPAVGRIGLYHFRDYLTKWDEIAALISRSAVTTGAFDTYLKGVKGKRGTTDVDDDFLAEMERWRDLLAHNIALRNPAITQRELNFAVQTTIDRLIFLRICEDRGIEPEEGLKNATDGIEVYGDLLELFRKADKKYNSGLFHFATEKNRPGHPDIVTPTLKIDDKVFKDILANLYLPKSPYRFNYFSADILGQVYERFLGRVIRLTPGHTAKVEEKPEVRKAGGVYYTPTYIVDYIVKNTVGELLKDKTPETLKTIPLRVLDPACGSGSFLLGAYQFLMDWYLEWYTANDPAKHARGAHPVVIETLAGWQLTLEKKREILTRHIFGVDIDNQAVEVTKLSLLLKVVENPGQLSLVEERILPDLGDNIKCGNSLIGPDFYEGQQGTLFDSEEQYRVNAFDWHASFPQVFRDGGFDAVIGNPPYIRIQTMKEWAPLEVEIYKKFYVAASAGNYDIYVVFIERAFSLLNQKGTLGFILPHKFFQAQFGKSIREKLSSSKALREIVHFGSEQVFENASTYTCLLFLNKTPRSNFKFISVNSLENPYILMSAINSGEEHPNYSLSTISHSAPDVAEWNFYAGEQDKVLSKLCQQKFTLADITRKIFVGLQTSADKIYVLKTIKEDTSSVICYSQSLEENIEIEKGFIKPFLMGKDIHRYEHVQSKQYVIFPYTIENGKASLMPQAFIKKNFPKGWNYLLSNKAALQDREKGKMKGDDYYAYIYPKNLVEFDSKKIMTPDIALGCQLTYDDLGIFYHTTTIYSFVFKSNLQESLMYFLGILNSKIHWYFLKSTGNVLRGGYFRFKTEYLKPFPIHVIDFSNPAEVTQHDRLVALVETILSLHKNLAAARLPDEKERLQRQIAATDRQIDQLVYQLYNLTPEEITIVEGS